MAAARGENAADTAAQIRDAGHRGEAAALEVTDHSSIDALMAGVVERHGRIDILVNNAGITRDQLMLRMKRDDWDQVIATNLTAAFAWSQAATNSDAQAARRPHHQHQFGGRSDR